MGGGGVPPPIWGIIRPKRYFFYENSQFGPAGSLWGEGGGQLRCMGVGSGFVNNLVHRFLIFCNNDCNICLVLLLLCNHVILFDVG